MTPEVPRNTLSKEERLCGKKDVEELLAKGKFRTCKNLKYCFRTDNGLDINRIMVSVGKKFFKRAVKRNLLKRRIRENYRTRKHLLPSEGGTDILFVYNSKNVLSSSELGENVETILKNISNGHPED